MISIKIKKNPSKAEKLPYSGAVPRLPGFPEMSCHWAWLFRSFGWIPGGILPKKSWPETIIIATPPWWFELVAVPKS